MWQVYINHILSFAFWAGSDSPLTKLQSLGFYQSTVTIKNTQSNECYLYLPNSNDNKGELVPIHYSLV